MKQADMKVIGSRIRKYRESQLLIREAFAEDVGISPQFLAEIETGKKGMSAETLYKICSQYHLSADYILFGHSNESSPDNPLMCGVQKLSPTQLQYLEEIISIYLKAVLRS